MYACNALCRINEVTLRRASFVLGRVTFGLNGDGECYIAAYRRICWLNIPVFSMLFATVALCTFILFALFVCLFVYYYYSNCYHYWL